MTANDADMCATADTDAAGLVTEFDGGGGGGRKEEEGGARDVRGREKEKSDGQRGQRVDNGPRPDDDDDDDERARS